MNDKHKKTAHPFEPPDVAGADTHELQRVLAQASKPALPAGAEDRLLQRLNAMPGPVRRIGTVEKAGDWSLPWLAGVPLAASLALGIYLGTAGTLDSWWPSSLTTADAASNWSADPADLGGLSDAETDAGGSLS